MVLCKIYRKATPLKELEQRASAMEQMMTQRPGFNGGYGGEARAWPVPVDVSAGDYYLSSPDDVQDNFLFHSSSSSSAAPSGSSKNYDAPMEAKKEADVATITVASASASASSPSQAANAPSDFQIPVANPPCSLQLPAANPPCSLQLPAANQGVFDWLQDPFLTQLRSPWQDQHCLSPYAHLLYY
jgi:hypothetical protein